MFVFSVRSATDRLIIRLTDLYYGHQPIARALKASLAGAARIPALVRLGVGCFRWEDEVRTMSAMARRGVRFDVSPVVMSLVGPPVAPAAFYE